jgi:hypothetical protein
MARFGPAVIGRHRMPSETTDEAFSLDILQSTLLRLAEFAVFVPHFGQQLDEELDGHGLKHRETPFPFARQVRRTLPSEHQGNDEHDDQRRAEKPGEDCGHGSVLSGQG